MMKTFIKSFIPNMPPHCNAYRLQPDFYISPPLIITKHLSLFIFLCHLPVTCEPRSALWAKEVLESENHFITWHVLKPGHLF